MLHTALTRINQALQQSRQTKHFPKTGETFYFLILLKCQDLHSICIAIIKRVWRLFRSLKTGLCGWAIPLLGISPKETKSHCERDTCTSLFLAELFTVTKTWKQPSCPLTDHWIKKIRNTYTVEYYSVIKTGILMTRMDLEGILLCEISHAQRQTLCDLCIESN